MPVAVYEILFLVSILLVVLVHEAGHFVFAKAFKMKVHEFFVGFGPRIWSTRRGDTEYGVKLLPLGGYVRIAGMNPYDEIPEDERGRTYGSKPAWQRAVTVAAGPITHFCIAFIVLFVLFVGVGVHDPSRPYVASVLATLDGKASPAAQAGLRAGDQIVGVDGIHNPSLDRFSAFIHDHAGRPVTVTVVRDGRTITVTATPETVTLAGQRVGRLGIGIDGLTTRSGPIASVVDAGKGVWAILVSVFVGIGHAFGPSGISRLVHLLGGAPRQTSDVGSLLGAAQITADASVHHDWGEVLYLFAAINMFVGVLNLVPLPPFDGGHLAVVAVEKVFRRRLDPRRLVPVAAAVLVFVAAISLSVLYLDIVNPIPNPFR